MKRLLALTLPCLLAGCLICRHDQAPQHDPLSWNGEVQAHGALREMFHEGRTGPTVSLGELLPDPQLHAVGALAGLTGEVTVLEGRVHLSYAEGDATRTETPVSTGAAATLLVATSVPAWRSVRTTERIRFEELDDEIASLAGSAGMDLDERFPFLVEGIVLDLQWHVIDGGRLAAGADSHRDHLAAAVTSRRHRTEATLVGFYSENDQGVFTHMGSRTHVHCVVDDPVAAGHVDHVVLPAGTVVKFPRLD